MTQKEKILEIVKAFPGANLAQIQELVDFRKDSVSARIVSLMQQGLITREGRLYFINEKPVPQLKEPKKIPSSGVKTVDDYTNLVSQVNELLEWKANAIKLYPQLGIKPEVLAARKIAMQYYEKINDRQKAIDINHGKYDDAPFMCMIIQALV